MATLTTGPFWVDHAQGGATYAVGHLHPYWVDYSIPAIAATKKKPGRAAVSVKVRFTYSHHCFTQAVAKVPNANPDHFYNCTKRPSDRRIFCPDRWAESLALPTIKKGAKKVSLTTLIVNAANGRRTKIPPA